MMIAKRLLCSLRAGITLILLLTLLLGALYPLFVTLIAKAAFPDKAAGSLIVQGDKIVGSSLLGQNFESPRYFWGRLSAAAYNPSASSGSNFNPGNPKLLEAASARIMALQKADPGNKAKIPADLVTASASGLDPHISPAAADYQIPRVARARHLKEEEVRALVQAATERRALGLLGEPRVNVLQLNLALDAKK